MVVSFLFLMMRVFARWRSFRKLGADDGLVIFAWLLALLTAAVWQVVAKFMYQFMAIATGQLWPPPATFVEIPQRYFKASVAVCIFLTTSLWAVKFSFLVFFWRLGQNVTRQKILWWCVFSFTCATYLVAIGIIQYSCLTSPPDQLVSHCSTNSSIHYERVTLKLHCAMDILTDFMSETLASLIGLRGQSR